MSRLSARILASCCCTGFLHPRQMGRSSKGRTSLSAAASFSADSTWSALSNLVCALSLSPSAVSSPRGFCHVYIGESAFPERNECKWKRNVTTQTHLIAAFGTSELAVDAREGSRDWLLACLALEASRVPHVSLEIADWCSAPRWILPKNIKPRLPAKLVLPFQLPTHVVIHLLTLFDLYA